MQSHLMKRTVAELANDWPKFLIYNKNPILPTAGFKQTYKKLFMLVHSHSHVSFSVKLDSEFMNIMMPVCDPLWIWTRAYVLAAFNPRDQCLDTLCIGTFWYNCQIGFNFHFFWEYMGLWVTGKSLMHNPLNPTDKQQHYKIQQDWI